MSGSYGQNVFRIVYNRKNAKVKLSAELIHFSLKKKCEISWWNEAGIKVPDDNKFNLNKYVKLHVSLL